MGVNKCSQTQLKEGEKVLYGHVKPSCQIRIKDGILLLVSFVGVLALFMMVD